MSILKILYAITPPFIIKIVNKLIFVREYKFKLLNKSGDVSRDLKRKIQVALSHGSMWTLAFLAFISVIREGIETIPFI